MKPITQEWVKKAEKDFSTAQLLASQTEPNFDLICFLSQQCVEKYLKACLQEANIYFPKTHLLPALLDLLLSTGDSWDEVRLTSKTLSAYATEFRYPGAWATEELAVQALKDCDRIRQVAIRYLEQESPDESREQI